MNINGSTAPHFFFSDGFLFEGPWFRLKIVVMSEEHVKEVIDKAIGVFEDFPKEGIVFRDIHPTLKSHEHRSLLLKFLVDRYKGRFI